MEPLPASPTLSPMGDAPTPRPTILIGGPSEKRSRAEKPVDVPSVDSAIESPGFRPSDDAIVRQKQENRYWQSDYDNYQEEYYDGDGFGWCSQPLVYRRGFTSPIDSRMTQEISANLENVQMTTGAVKLTMIEEFLRYFLTAEYVVDYLEANPSFADMLEKKIGEFEKNPRATERIKSICSTLRGIYFL